MANLRQQIGQMLIMGFAGTSLSEQIPMSKWLSEENLGGVLLFDYDVFHQREGKNLVNETQIKELTTRIKHYGEKEGIFPFVALDYEGGAVDRLRHIEGAPATKTPQELAKFSLTEFQAEVEMMAKTLARLGFNLNFAPVVDLNLNNQQGIIGRLGRCFSDDPKRVAQLAHLFVEMFYTQGITCCYKHFPGHGSAVGDTHYELVDVSETAKPSELEPYALLSKTSLPAMVMTAHVINRQYDPSGLPATLSSLMLNDLLRKQLGFEGVIVSDDLQMQAISSQYSLENILQHTINAGADMLIFANQLAEIGAPEVINCIEALVQSGAIKQSRIADAYQRIFKLKKEISRITVA